MEERGLVGLEARTRDGEEVIGRIVEVLTDEETGEITHVVVETDEGSDEEQVEVPITDVNLDPDADFATFPADPSDEVPGDHVGDVERPEGYAPGRVSWRRGEPDEIDEAQEADEADKPEGLAYSPSRGTGPEDWPHEGQFVGAPEDESEAQSPEELDREADEAGGFQDESFTPADSGYPRTDAYIDADTGEERERYTSGEDLRTDVEAIIDGTDLRVRDVVEGVVGLEGSIGSQEDLEEILSDVRDLDDVLDVDVTDVDVG